MSTYASQLQVQFTIDTTKLANNCIYNHFWCWLQDQDLRDLPEELDATLDELTSIIKN